MKQPELGKKIATLRADQGLTQEELVDRCNISVRTIQRIEAGEVTPRHYTLRIILEALGQEFEEIRQEQVSVPKKTLKQMQIGWIAGICYFLVAFPEGLMDLSRWDDEWGVMGLSFVGIGYTLVKLGVVVSLFYFMRGFVRLGEYLADDLLRIAAILLAGLTAVLISLDIASLFVEYLSDGIYLVPMSICFGIVAIIFGITLVRHKERLGTVVVLAGVMEIIAGSFFLFVLPFGLLFLVPAEILAIITLYRGHQLASKGTLSSGQETFQTNGAGA